MLPPKPITAVTFPVSSRLDTASTTRVNIKTEPQNSHSRADFVRGAPQFGHPIR